MIYSNPNNVFSTPGNEMPQNPGKTLIYTKKTLWLLWFIGGLLELEQMQRKTTRVNGESTSLK